MFDFFQQFIKQAKNVFGKLDPKQKLVVMVVSIFCITMIVYLMAWTGERQWKVLFSNLEPEDANAVIEQLDQDGIPYRVETEGTAIMVEQGQEFELRLKYQAQGLITGGSVGYEIFDRPSIGMTDFLQQVNYKRSLEGELSRTIRSLESVENSRVTIVLPRAALFTDDQKEATASVLLTLKAGTSLTSEQINTIGMIVANSIEGLIPANVAISDSHGNNLSQAINKDPLIQIRSDQLKMQRSYEIQIQNKLESLLSETVGPNNYNVNVSLEMDFTQSHSTSIAYNPSAAATPTRSEETESSTGGTIDSVSAASSAERTTSNFEIDQTTTDSINEYGVIKRMTIAVLVNGTYADVNGVRTYSARTGPDIATLLQSVQNASGYDASRNDFITVQDYQFDTAALTDELAGIDAQERNDLISLALKWIGIVVAGIVFIFVLRSVFRSLDLLLPKPKPKPAIDIEAEAIEEEISAEAQRRTQMLEQVSRFTREKPSNVASLLSTWLIEEK